MAHFDKNSNEYNGNGHYNVGGKEFMSIWTFKNKHKLTPNNNNVNGAEGQQLFDTKVEFHSCTPDFGGFASVFIYPVTELENYYGI
ncbi:MAG: hypothetical protein IPG89_05630 [Bacteroidetes bacterium]|nr:hypothetical protein [Bacteroidota bacterium]